MASRRHRVASRAATASSVPGRLERHPDPGGRPRIGDRSMTTLIDILREEHRNIEKLLGVLEQELSVFDHRQRPDFDTLRAIIDYFEEYPARCHHPKEDMMVDILKVRDPVVAAALGDMQSDHREEADRLLELARTIESVRTGSDLSRDSVVAAVRDFIAHERRHMALEERELFPA